MRSNAALAALLIALGPLVSGLQVHPAPGMQDFTYGDPSASIRTDAQDGTLRLWKPTQVGDCRDFVTTQNAAASNTFTGIHLDRAGYWSVDHETGSGTTTTSFRVEPQALRILVTPIDAGRGDWDYDVHIVHDGAAAPNAYLDLYHQDVFIRHYRSDDEGTLRIHHADLPIAGTYELRAYKDLDEPVTEYLNAYTPPGAPSCDANKPVDEPELLGLEAELSPGHDAVQRFTDELVLQHEDRALIRNQDATLHLGVTDRRGFDVLATRVELVRDGQTVTPASLGLTAELLAGEVVLSGSWGFEGGLLVRVERDANGDGELEHRGSLQLYVHPPRPVRMVALDGSSEISFQVPARQAEGRPGVQDLRFRLLDRDGNQGRPPTLTADDFTFTGDVLGSHRVAYDAAGEHWVIQATPKNSDATYHVTVDWPDKGRLTLTIDMPAQAGARSTLESQASLVVGESGDVRVLVERVNDDASTQACRDAGGVLEDCQYSSVPDAHVALFWADTGAPVQWTDTSGGQHAYEYRPGQAQSCDCVAFDGHYIFRGIKAERSGILAAYAVVDANAPNEGRYTYAEVQVQPQPVFVPQVEPSLGLAGEYTRYRIHVPGTTYNADTYQEEFETVIHNESGADVTSLGSFSTAGGNVYWSVALPHGAYHVTVTERLDPEKGLLGLRGTSTPGILNVLPAELRIQYNHAAPHQGSLNVDLSQPRVESWLLGGGFGDAVLLRLDVQGPLHRPTGYLVIDGVDSDTGEAFAVFAQAHQDTPEVRDEHVFAAGEPRWICDGAGGEGSECSATYTVQAPQDVDFYGRLRVFTNGEPVYVLARGHGAGNATFTFHSTQSSPSQAHAAQGVLHVVPPDIHVDSISTRHGIARQPALAFEEINLVRLEAWDPTGYHDLEGVTVGLTRDLYGPSQRPGALLQPQEDRDALAAVVGIKPDATGDVRVVASHSLRIQDTHVRLPVRVASSIDYDASSTQVLVDIPSHVTSGALFQVRVATATDPTPTGVVARVFEEDHVMVAGFLTLQAPETNTTRDYPVTIYYPGHPALSYILQVQAPPAPTTPSPSTPALDVEGLPDRVQAGSILVLRAVDASGTRVAGAQASLGGRTATSDQDGDLRLPAPTAPGAYELVLSKAGYDEARIGLQVHAAASPRLHLDLPDTLLPFEDASVRVTATDAAGQSLPVPSDVRLSIETTWITLQSRAGEAVGTYQVPALESTTPVYAIARAPGYQEARLLVSIEGVHA